MTGHPGRSEHSEQCAVIDWANLQLRRWPELKWLFAIPNVRSSRIQRMRLGREGVKPGVADLHLPVARGGYFGLYIEMKVKPNKLTHNQTEFMHFVIEQGYHAVVAYGADQAIEMLEEYLSEPPTAFPALVDELDT